MLWPTMAINSVFRKWWISLAFYNKKYLIGVTLIVWLLTYLVLMDRCLCRWRFNLVFLGPDCAYLVGLKTSSCLTVLSAWTISLFAIFFPSPCLRLPWTIFHLQGQPFFYNWLTKIGWIRILILERLWSINFLNGSILHKKRELLAPLMLRMQ